jgi:hypothetical protein
VLLSQGKVMYDGPVAGALSVYHSALEAGIGVTDGEPAEAHILAELLDADDVAQRHFATGDEITVRIQVSFDAEVNDPLLGVMVAPLGMGATYTLNTTPGAYAGTHGPGRPLSAEVRLTNRMLDGSYSVWIGVHSATGAQELGRTEAMVFYVSSTSGRARGFVDLEAQITMEGQEIAEPGRRRLDGGRAAMQSP